MRRAIQGTVALLFLLGVTATAIGENSQSGSKAKGSLQEIEGEIKEWEQRVREMTGQERKLLAELRQVEEVISRHEKELKGMAAALEQKIRDARQTEARIDRAKAALALREQDLKLRLVSRYKLSKVAYMGILSSVGTPGPFLRRHKFVELLAANDKRLITAYRLELLNLTSTQERLVQEVARLSRMLEELKGKKEEVEKARERREAVLRALATEKNRYLTAIEELRKASAELQGLVESVSLEPGPESLPGGGFQAFRGRLNPPVAGELAGVFGKVEDPRFHTVTMRNGVEIVAPYGEEVRSIYYGRVVYSRPFKGLGNVVIIDHGDGYYTVYGRASQLLKKEGERVTKDEVIAFVGDGGPLNEPHLYFEVRYRGRPVDPLKWIRLP